MKVHFIDLGDDHKILRVQKDNDFIPVKGDLLDLEGIEFIVDNRNINYDKNIIEIYLIDS